MARLYGRNVPDEQYEALRRRAAKHHRSIAAEVVAMLETLLTARELEARRSAAKMTTKNTTTSG